MWCGLIGLEVCLLVVLVCWGIGPDSSFWSFLRFVLAYWRGEAGLGWMAVCIVTWDSECLVPWLEDTSQSILLKADGHWTCDQGYSGVSGLQTITRRSREWPLRRRRIPFTGSQWIIWHFPEKSIGACHTSVDKHVCFWSNRCLCIKRDNAVSCNKRHETSVKVNTNKDICGNASAFKGRTNCDATLVW